MREFINIVGAGPKQKTKEEEVQSFIAATKILSMRTIWFGGSESHTFNRLEEIASQRNAVTPILGCRISRVLETSKVFIAFSKISKRMNNTGFNPKPHPNPISRNQSLLF